jgi:transposase
MRGITVKPSVIKEVLRLYAKKICFRQIASGLKISKTQVGRIIERERQKKFPRRQGAPRKLTDRQIRSLKMYVMKNRKMGTRLLPKQLKLSVSSSTILRTLHELCLKKKSFRRRPILTKEHKQKRITFALEHYPKKEALKKWVFTDEKKFRFDGPDGWNKFWVHKHDKKFKPSMSKDYGRYRGVMVWGAVSTQGLLCLERTTAKMKGDDYLKMVTGRPLDIMRKTCGSQPVFIQDNAAPHKKDTTVDGLKDAGLEVPEWPPLSPDLNPMENVWALIVKKLYTGTKAFESEDELWKGIESIGKTITPEEVAPYVDSVPDRMRKVIEKKGGYVQQK